MVQIQFWTVYTARVSEGGYEDRVRSHSARLLRLGLPGWVRREFNFS
jgi:hypothetical protein